MNEEALESNSNNNELPSRGFWLTAFLILMYVGNAYSSYLYFFKTELIANQLPETSITIIYVLGALTIINIILATGIFFWKKWGAYGFYAVGIVGYIINVSIGLGASQSTMGLIGPVLIYLLTKNKWSRFS